MICRICALPAPRMPLRGRWPSRAHDTPRWSFLSSAVRKGRSQADSLAPTERPLSALDPVTGDEFKAGCAHACRFPQERRGTKLRSNDALRPPDRLNQPDRRRAQAINKERVDSGFGGPARQRREHAGSRDLTRALAQFAQQILDEAVIGRALAQAFGHLHTMVGQVVQDTAQVRREDRPGEQ